jgi:hypothetical protein
MPEPFSTALRATGMLVVLTRSDTVIATVGEIVSRIAPRLP